MPESLYEIPLRRIDGTPASLADYRGHVLLIVNVASNCGLTSQYAALEGLYQEKRRKGFEVLGFPANNFLRQEPGSDSEIAEFCSNEYDVHFPLFSKISVLGVDQHPLYTKLTAARPAAIGDGTFRVILRGYGINADSTLDVLWNFEKFLLSRRGEVVARFAPDVDPNDPRLIVAIDSELAKNS